MQGLACHVKTLKSVSRGNEEPLKDFKLESDMIRFMF